MINFYYIVACFLHNRFGNCQVYETPIGQKKRVAGVVPSVGIGVERRRVIGQHCQGIGGLYSDNN